jgi:hypothetical protein
MFRFTIQDVLWLTALVAVVVAWGIDRYTAALKLQALQGDYGVLKSEMQRAQAEAMWQRSLSSRMFIERVQSPDEN